MQAWVRWVMFEFNSCPMSLVLALQLLPMCNPHLCLMQCNLMHSQSSCVHHICVTCASYMYFFTAVCHSHICTSHVCVTPVHHTCMSHLRVAHAGFWKWNFVATKRRDSEAHSSSFYTQSDLTHPPTCLTHYVDGDSIREQDLVVWVNSGLYHVPMAEDAPVTPASGHNQLGFSLM